MKRYYDLVFVTYLLMSPLCYLLPIPEIVRAFLALPSILLLPLHFGYGILKLWERLNKRRVMLRWPVTLLVILSWCIGILAITVFWILFIPLGALGSRILLVIVIIASLLSLIDGAFDEIFVQQMSSRSILFVIASAVMGVLPFVYIRSISSFPYMPAFDQFPYSVHITQIIEGHPFFEAFPAIYVMMALPSAMFGIDPLPIFWSAPLILYMLFPAGVYLFSYRLSKNKWLSLFSALISVWVFGVGMVCDMHYFLRRNILYVLFPFSLYLMTLSDVKIKSDGKYVATLFTLPLLFYLMASPAIYCYFIVKQPIEMLLSPFYTITKPAVFIGSPVSYVQPLYALTIVTLIFFLIKDVLKIGDGVLSTWFILSLTAFFFHLDMGLFFSILLLLYVSLPLWFKEHPTFTTLLVLTLSSIFFLYFSFRSTNGRNDIARGLVDVLEIVPNWISTRMAELGYVFDFNWKIKFLENTYTLPVIVVSFLGLVSLIKDSSKNRYYLPAFFLYSSITFLYLLPWPFAFRMLTFLTPFVGFCASYIFFSLYDLVCDTSIDERCWAIRMKDRRIRLRPSKFLLAGFLILTLLSVTSLYGHSIRYLRLMYNYKGNVTTYTDLDVEAATWIRANMPYETVIVADPITRQMLCGLTGFGYTFEGRMFISETVTLPIPWGIGGLFKKVLGSYTYQDLEKIRELYGQHEEYFGDGSSAMEMIVVVNGRTKEWIAGRDCSRPLGFRSFSGFERLTASRTLSLVFNHTGQYYIFKAERETLETGFGPYVLVSEIDVPDARPVLTRYSYYEYFDANFTLSLSGQTGYNVSGYPYTWSFEEALINGVPTAPMRGWDANKHVLISNVSSRDHVTIIWKADLRREDVLWRDDSFMEGWSQGPVSRSGMKGYGYVSDGDVVALFLSAGGPGDYTSIRRHDLYINSSAYPIFSVRMKGTDNTEALIYLVLEDGTTVYPFVYWLKLTNEWADLSEDMLPKTHGMEIRGVLILYKTVDGEPAEVCVDYVMFTAS